MRKWIIKSCVLLDAVVPWQFFHWCGQSRLLLVAGAYTCPPRNQKSSALGKINNLQALISHKPFVQYGMTSNELDVHSIQLTSLFPRFVISNSWLVNCVFLLNSHGSRVLENLSKLGKIFLSHRFPVFFINEWIPSYGICYHNYGN